MTKEEQNAAALERLIAALLDHPRDMTIAPSYLHQRINIRVDAEVNDLAKFVGKKGAHLKALAVVARKMGDQLEQVWTIAPGEPTGGVRRHPGPDTPPPAHHSPTADLHLLGDVLEACTGQTYALSSDEEGGASWRFLITPRDWAAHESLVDKAQADAGDTLVAALGTLFRAIGRRQGVSYRVEIPGATP